MPFDALDPTWIDAPGGVGPTYNSEELRRDMGFLLSGGATADVSRTGVLDTRALTVTLSGSNVQINPGGCAIGTGKGAYLTGASATATIDALTAADATNPRRDRVVLEVLDPDNGGGAGRKAQFRVIVGTPSATAASGGGYPSAPTSPSITLAYIDVPKSGAGSAVVTDVRPYTAAAGAPIPVRDATDRSTVPTWVGRTVARLDAGGAREVWTGSEWGRLVGSADTGWLDVPLLNGFTPLTFGGWGGAKYAVRNGWAIVALAVERSPAWSGGVLVAANIPAPYRPSIRVKGTDGWINPNGDVVPTGSGPGQVSVWITYPLV